MDGDEGSISSHDILTLFFNECMLATIADEQNLFSNLVSPPLTMLFAIGPLFLFVLLIVMLKESRLDDECTLEVGKMNECAYSSFFQVL